MKKKNYYIISDGKLKRHENTIYFENEDGKRPIPVNTIYSIYAFASLTLTSKALSLLSSNGVCIHFFNRYGFYVGSFYPRETLVSGDVIVRQVEHYLDKDRRLYLARAFVKGSIMNMLKVLNYYGADISGVERGLESLSNAGSLQEVMGAEASSRNAYYSAFDGILKEFKFEERSRRPPKNEVNALLSFGNSLLYSTVLSEIYHTQLNPAISYLHEPFERRFSLALDIADVFKPLLVDRTVFSVVNKGVIGKNDFRRDLKGVLLNENGIKKFLKAYNDKLETTVKHRKLGRKVSYQRLIRLECYKLVKHLIGTEKYEPFVVWW